MATPGTCYSYMDGDGQGEYTANQVNGKREDRKNGGPITSHGQKRCPSDVTRGARHKSKPGNDGILALMCQWTVDHQIGRLSRVDLS